MVIENKLFHHTSPLEDSKVVSFLEKKLGVRPDTVRSPPEIWAEYHKIYIATVGDSELFLRISKPAIPEAKTRNEVACILWVQQHIKACPVPEIVAWNASTDELGYEYVLLRRLPGRDLAVAFENMTDQEMNSVIARIADMCIAMAELPFNKVGGLTINDSGKIEPGPVVEETTYDVQNLEMHWKGYPDVTFDKLQIGGPFDSMTEYFEARLRRDLYVLSRHEQCSSLNETFAPSVQELLDSLTDMVKKHVEVRPLCLAHQDLHLGNILWDNQLTGVLDWEFSGITPLDQWIRRNTFASNIDEAMQKVPIWRKKLLEDIKFKNRKVWEDLEIVPIKDMVLKLISLTFWIVHCTVTDTQADDRKVWIQRFNQSMDTYKATIRELD
jgi:aminoglycoside phosphotransferase